MSIRKVLLVYFIALFVLVFPLYSDAAVDNALIRIGGVGTFPIDSPIGPMEDPSRPSHPAISHVFSALRDFYRPNWFELYIESEAIYALNTLHNKRLARSLPAIVGMGKTRVSSSQVYLPVILFDREDQATVWDVFLIKDTDDNWRITSITIP